ncbi:MAG TPA: Imm10 family immunity protein [Niastella sp.]
MSVISFKAQVISAEKNREDKYYMVGLADGKFDYENYVILQKAFKFDKDDIDAGMDGHYFEVNDQGNSAYKCCKKVILRKDSIEFILDSSRINDIENIVIDVSGVKITAKFLEYLREILGNILEESV